MINPAYGTPCVDPTADLSEKHKQAASSAGYGIPFISEEQKYKQALLEQQAQSLALGIK